MVGLIEVLSSLIFFCVAEEKKTNAQSPPTNGTDFSCSKSSTPCSTYAAYFAQEPDFLDPQNISDLFGTSPQEIARASNLASEDAQLFPGQLLLIGDKVVFPLFCKCPSKAELENGTEYFISYVWQPNDNELTKSESFLPKIIHKLLPGVSGYLGKPIMYETNVIMGATMNLNEHCRIGGSVYRATIDGKLLVIKKTKDDITEELKILQKVNHANLVKLIGVSADSDGNFFLVYEYAENGSLDKAKIANFSVARTTTNSIIPKVDVFAFGVVLLELLSGKKAMATKENGEIFMLWKNLKEVLEIEEKKEKRLRKWMDPNLESFYPVDGALSLAVLAMACTQENPLVRPSMVEIVFSLSVLIQSSFETLEGSWSSGIETELAQIIVPVVAR
ncbi:hypothetical protein REPUB_Repub10bG0156600 [Reevesia pubescens]